MNLPDFKDIASASRQVATYSAMNPILWKTVICSPIAMICSVIAAPPLSYMLFALACLPILVGAWGFVHFARTDPRRLQSEGHIEQMQRLSMRLGTNEPGAPEILIPPNSPVMNNPEMSEEGQG